MTGAGRGIGRAVSIELAAAGARIILVSRTETDLARVTQKSARVGRRGSPVTSLMSRPRDGVARAQQWGGRLDAVINNAGIGWRGPIHTMPLDAWRRLIDVNLTGSFFLPEPRCR